MDLTFVKPSFPSYAKLKGNYIITIILSKNLQTRVPGENQVTDKLLSYNVISSTPSHERDSSSQR
jgi:hypothetical protein